MQITIKINCDNSSFIDSGYGIVPEAAKILATLAEKMDLLAWDECEQAGSLPLFDVNGNRVGACEFTDGSSHDGIKPLLRTVLQYLEHPDVASIPFALSSSVVAKRLREAIENI